MKNLFFLISLCLGFWGCQQQSMPVAVDGVLDASHWDFSQKGSLTLNGEWDFYWERFIPLDSDAAMPQTKSLLTMPAFWSDVSLEGKESSSFGYASYHLTVLLPDTLKEVALLFSEICTAGKIYVNGLLIYESGVVGTSREESVPLNKRSLVPFTVAATDGKLNIIIHASNYFDAFGGLYASPIIGLESDVAVQNTLKIASEILVVVLLLLFGFFNIIQFVFQRNSYSLIALAAFSFIWAARSFSDGIVNNIIGDLLVQIPHGVSMAILYVSFYITPPLIMHFFYDLFSDNFKKGVVFKSYLFSAFLILVVLVTPQYIYEHPVFIWPASLWAFGLMAFIWMHILPLASKQKRKETVFLTAGSLFLTLAAANDLLNELKIIHTAYYTDWGAVFFVVCNTLALQKKYAEAYNSLEDYSHKLERIDQMKDEFLANTSHELRTPLTGIIGIAQSFQHETYGKITDEMDQNLSVIVSSAKRLSQLINDILDFSKLKHSGITLYPSQIDLHSVVNAVITGVKPLLKHKDVRIYNRIPEQMPMLYADENRIIQVFYNILGNAAKFTLQGEIAVTASVEKTSIVVGVSDTGIGIAEEKLSMIFDSFQQAEDSLTKEFSGTGLGLAISRHLVELHGGRISVASREGKGSTFTISLPLDNALSQKTLQKEKEFGVPSFTEVEDNILPLPVIAQTTRKFHILAVDDEQVNLQVIVSYFKDSEIAVSTASNGVEALQWIEANSLPDLMILDVMMPYMNGYDVCKKVREKYSEIEFPIIMVTARTGPNDVMTGFMSGANDYIPKPFLRDEMIARIQAHLKIKEAYLTLQENQLLKESLQEQKNRTYEQEVFNERLSLMLNTVRTPLLAVGDQMQIHYANQEAQSLLGDLQEASVVLKQITFQEAETLEDYVDAVCAGEDSLPEKEWKQCAVKPAHKRKSLPMNLSAVPLMVTDVPMVIVMFYSAKDQSNPQHVADYLAEMNRSRSILRLAHQSLQSVSFDDAESLTAVVGQLKQVEESILTMHSHMTREGKMDIRELTVRIMNRVVVTWEKQTGQSKTEFARQSGLWKIHQDKNGWERTQVLDNYMDLSKVPKNPRLYSVIQSIHFLLASCEVDPETQASLEKDAVSLKLALRG